VEAIKRLQFMAEKDRERAAKIIDIHQVFNEQIADLTKANDQTTTLEMSSKLSIAKEQLD
jgi:hypothetical protein